MLFNLACYLNSLAEEWKCYRQEIREISRWRKCGRCQKPVLVSLKDRVRIRNGLFSRFSVSIRYPALFL